MLLQLTAHTDTALPIAVLLLVQGLQILIYLLLAHLLVLMNLALELVLLHMQVVELGAVKGWKLECSIHLNIVLIRK